MLSIVIPHYNFINEKLFKEIEQQCLSLHLIFEIIIIDDASSITHNNYLRQFNASYFKIIFLKENIGRAAIRNLLAAKASYPYLLFLDGDSEITNPNFIHNYISYFQQNPATDITCGLRYYPKIFNEKEVLHHHYGIKREMITAKHIFHSNNFLIKKKVFDDLNFDENLTQYGYEDVLFGLSAKYKGFIIKNIDNPVRHLQLKSNVQFMADVDDAVQNLVYLMKQEKYLTLLREIPVVKYYLIFKQTGLLKLLSPLKPYLRKNLETQKPDLLTIKKLPLYKLLVLYHFLS